MEKEKHAGGAPELYKEEYNEQAYKLCLLGATNEEIADFFNVCTSTIDNWNNKYPEFLGSIKKGKLLADANVAEKLYHRACGYEHKEDKIFNDNGVALIVPTIKRYAPDPTSGIFWLKNRQPKKFRDKIETEHSGELKTIEVKRASFED